MQYTHTFGIICVICSDYEHTLRITELQQSIQHEDCLGVTRTDDWVLQINCLLAQEVLAVKVCIVKGSFHETGEIFSPWLHHKPLSSVATNPSTSKPHNLCYADQGYYWGHWKSTLYSYSTVHSVLTEQEGSVRTVCVMLRVDRTGRQWAVSKLLCVMLCVDGTGTQWVESNELRVSSVCRHNRHAVGSE